MTGYSKVFLDIAPRMDCLDNDVDFGEVEFPDQKKAVGQIGLSAERKLFEEFSGSVDRIIDGKTEKMEALDEKYL